MDNATYARNIPLLPRLASGRLLAEQEGVENIQAGDPLSANHIVQASKQYKQRKRLGQADPGSVTDDELVAAKRRKHAVESAHFDGPTPLWAVQLQQNMQEEMQQIRREVREIRGGMEQMQQNMLQQMDRSIQIAAQRSRNYSIRSTSDRITPLMRASDGSLPEHQGLWFPANHKQLFVSDLASTNALLTFYNFDIDGLLIAKRDRLANHLGVIL